MWYLFSLYYCASCLLCSYVIKIQGSAFERLKHTTDDFFHHPGQNLVEMPQIRVSWMIQQYFGNYFVLNEISIQVYSSINFFEKWATLKATKSLGKGHFPPTPIQK